MSGAQQLDWLFKGHPDRLIKRETLPPNITSISILRLALVLIAKNRSITLPLSFITIDGILSAGLKGQVK